MHSYVVMSVVMCLVLNLKTISTRNSNIDYDINLGECRLHHCKWFIVVLSLFVVDRSINVSICCTVQLYSLYHADCCVSEVSI